jgi:hypothetical protein
MADAMFSSSNVKKSIQDEQKESDRKSRMKVLGQSKGGEED